MDGSVRIAWVEDDTPIIEPVVFQLKRANYHIDRYGSYSEALRNRDVIFASQLILLDIIIPVGDVEAKLADASLDDPYLGFRLVRTLYVNGIDSGRKLPPVLILSAAVTGELIERFQKEFEGKVTVAYLRKPALPTTLKEKVDALLAKTV
jgi:CheY-like chemotaxis protein